MKAFKKPALEIADIVSKHAGELNSVSTQCHRVMRDIKNCRTHILGGHTRKCGSCDFKESSYNSCRNRHCPKCQYLKKVKWVNKRVEELLPCQYFHVVFTLPANLNPLILRNKRKCYDILFKASAETLKEVASNPKNLGAEIGFVGVLHTWGQNLMDHPHIHYIVPGGGLNSEKTKWINSKESYLLPVKILSKVFRGKFLSMLEKSFNEAKLEFSGKVESLQNKSEFQSLLVEASRKNWVVYSKEPFAGAEQVINYLGQYTHRIAISNHRLLKLKDGKVHFRYRDYADGNNSKVLVLKAEEFLRRFLMHVLPRGYVRIRHFGLFSNRFKERNLEMCRDYLKVKKVEVKRLEGTWQKIMKELSGVDFETCSNCKTGTIEFIPIQSPPNTS
jgi:hypothetical protein